MHLAECPVLVRASILPVGNSTNLYTVLGVLRLLLLKVLLLSSPPSSSRWRVTAGGARWRR